MNLPPQSDKNNQQPTKEESVNQNCIVNETTRVPPKEPANLNDLGSDAFQERRSSCGSSHSVNELIISEFTLEEVNEILNCKLSDDEDNKFLNDTNYTKTLLQQEFSHARSLQHLNDLEKSEQAKGIENGLKRTAETENELNESLQSTKNDLIRNLANLDVANERSECDKPSAKPAAQAGDSFESRFDHKFANQSANLSELDAECLNGSAIFNPRKTGYHKTVSSSSKLGCSSKQGVKSESSDYEKPILGNVKTANAKANDPRDSESCYYLTRAELVEKDHRPAISPPPEFQSTTKDLADGRDAASQLNDELKHQFKRQLNLNKHLQSRWSSADQIQKPSTFASSDRQFDANRDSAQHLNVTALPPPFSFSGSSSPNRSIGGHHSSMLALPNNKPKLPTKTKGDLLNVNSKLSSAKKLPSKLKSLPEIFTSGIASKIGSSNQKSLYATHKPLDERTTNTFTSTSLVSQMKQSGSISNQASSCQISQRPLPPLPLNLESYPWYHNLEREASSQLLEKFGVEGGYLVRNSKRAGVGSPFSLSIFHDGKCFNLNIRKRDDGLFALGKEKEKEKVSHSMVLMSNSL